MPHAGDWRHAEIFREGLEFNHPLIARVLAPHAGDLPPRWGFLSVEPSNIVLSALKPARNGDVLLRVYEATGMPIQNGMISFTPILVTARESNLVEDEGVVSPRIRKCHSLSAATVRNQELQTELQSRAEALTRSSRRRMQFLSFVQSRPKCNRKRPEERRILNRGWP